MTATTQHEPAGLQIQHLTKIFGGTVRAIDDVSLSIQPGELVSFLGPSGCGKTTLLRIIAGLEAPDQGQVLLEGEDSTDLHVRERQVGFVFQHYALFRHMTVFENVAFGLRVRPKKTRPSEAEIHRRVHELLSLVQLDWLANRYPPQLSGGQRQRLLLARALYRKPKFLLLDEATSALDNEREQAVNQSVRNLGITSLIIAHRDSTVATAGKRVGL